jgi:hydroxymethylglutaryl-CoA lyase
MSDGWMFERRKMKVTWPQSVVIRDVGPRDGFQAWPRFIPTAVKIDVVKALMAAGVKEIETTSFVNPHSVPQMADAAEVMAAITRRPGVSYPVLVPNLRGFQRAQAAGAGEISVFGAASETFSQKNINCSVAESLARFQPVVEAAAGAGIRVRGYVSCVLGCPYEGDVPVEAVARVARALHEMGCYEISLGDTIGVGTPRKAQAMVDAVAEHVPRERLAAHFHDTYGQALANLLAVMQRGVSVVDSAVAGLGGCPYAKGATGNVATEDVLYMLDGLGIETGVDLDALVEVALYISKALGQGPTSKVSQAVAAKR